MSPRTNANLDRSRPARPAKRPGAFRQMASAGVRVGRDILTLALLSSSALAFAQAPPPPPTASSPDQVTISTDAYVTHGSSEFGGHIVDYSGSGAMWDTLVNISSGPRELGSSVEMHAKDHYAKDLLFNDLSMNSFGFGGDPNNVVNLRMSKGRLYTFNGLFRRDRNYFDYDLLANPLIPTTSNPYVPLLFSPHLSNTVRRMTDTDITLLPQSRVAIRLGYSSNIWQGPSYSTIHEGAEGLLLQNIRNSTEYYDIGFDWKAHPKTLVSYDQFILEYKGNTNWNLTGLNYQLANGTPVSLGIDFFTVNGSPCAAPITNPNTTPPTANPTCNGYLAYNRSAPTRGLAPTEQLRVISSSVKRLQMTGRVAYTQSNNNVPQYFEFNNGLTSRTALRTSTDTGNAYIKRINVAGEGGITADLTEKISVSDALWFTNFRIPGKTIDNETAFFGTSMLIAPNVFTLATCPPPYTAATCPQHSTSSTADLSSTQSAYFLQQQVITNTFLISFRPLSTFGIQAGYRYRDRTINDAQNINVYETYYPTHALRGDCATGTLLPNGTCQAQTNTNGADNIPIHENWALFGLWLQPSPKFRANFNADIMSADNAFTRISPGQLQHYRVRATYRPQKWLNVAGSINLFQSTNNLSNNHQHARDYSISAMMTKSEYWSFDLNYSYDSVYSSTDICYVSSVAPTTTPACPTDPAPYLLGNAYYNQPTNFGSASFMLHPAERVTANFGYTVSSVQGQSELLNPRQVQGSLQSLYETPFARIAVTLRPRLVWNAEWLFKEYNESSPVGPTAPRDFRGNIYTLSLRYNY
jgi:hypothetical protein